MWICACVCLWPFQSMARKQGGLAQNNQAAAFALSSLMHESRLLSVTHIHSLIPPTQVPPHVRTQSFAIPHTVIDPGRHLPLPLPWQRVTVSGAKAQWRLENGKHPTTSNLLGLLIYQTPAVSHCFPLQQFSHFHLLSFLLYTQCSRKHSALIL